MKPARPKVGIVSTAEHVKELMTDIYLMGFNPICLEAEPTNIPANISILIVRTKSSTSKGLSVVHAFRQQQEIKKDLGQSYIRVISENGSKEILKALSEYKRTLTAATAETTPLPATVLNLSPTAPSPFKFTKASEAIEAWLIHFNYFTPDMLDVWSTAPNDEADMIGWFNKHLGANTNVLTPQMLRVFNTFTKGALRLARNKFRDDKKYPYFPVYLAGGKRVTDVLCLNSKVSTNTAAKEKLAELLGGKLEPYVETEKTETVIESAPVVLSTPAPAAVPTSLPIPPAVPLTIPAPVNPTVTTPTPLPLSVPEAPPPAPESSVSKQDNPQEELDTLMDMLAAQMRKMSIKNHTAHGINVNLLKLHLKMQKGGYACGVTASQMPGAQLTGTFKLADTTCESCMQSPFYAQAEWVLNNMG